MASNSDETVSVVIPTYYRNDELDAAVESVFAQRYDPIEIVVVDDSGEAHAAPVVADDDRVTYVPLEENRGPYAAREIGIERSTGRYVQLLDDDDRLLPGKLEAQVPRLRSNSDVGVAYCGLRWEDGPTVHPDPTVRGDVLEDALQFSTSPAMMGTMLVERSVLEALLPFPNRHGADDIGLKIELARQTDFDYVDEVLLVRGRSSNSVGTSWDAIEGRHEILSSYANLYAEYPDAWRRALAETYLVSGQFRLNDRIWSPAAIADFARALYHAPGLPPVYLGSLIAALFGRGVYRRSRSLYSSIALGDERAGKTM
ncbi:MULTISPECIES: glycosyltransferase [Halostella]|uniref:glycosyltransferase family 2 protein n=1 Tax=Halostella TaxID=1843185 RepID=UPI001F453023|nr:MULTISPECIES: glycosyltransferase [Halostella]